MVPDIEADADTAKRGRYTTPDDFRMAVRVFFKTDALATN